MKVEKYFAQISEFRTQLCELLSKDALRLYDVIGKKPIQFNVQGVYVISTPDDREIVYVGKTRTSSIIERLSDHRSGRSDLKGMLKQEIDRHLVRCVEIANSLKRTYFEFFLIGILQPPCNE